MDAIKQLFAEKLTETLEETLENMAFLSIDPATAETAAEYSNPLKEVHLLVTAPVLMELRLRMAEELLFQVVETMYIMDRTDVTEQLINDLLSEILNTLAGRFMADILPTNQTFSLGLPEVMEDNSPSEDNLLLQTFFQADEHPLSVSIMAPDMDDIVEYFEA
ncbi:MAG: chemotaxis protein CheX [Desulfuromonadaceae bacterium]|nr:chemotaxis protein CheX [Desulfuromonadaceae bacterium]